MPSVGGHFEGQSISYSLTMDFVVFPSLEDVSGAFDHSLLHPCQLICSCACRCGGAEARNSEAKVASLHRQSTSHFRSLGPEQRALPDEALRERAKSLRARPFCVSSKRRRPRHCLPRNTHAKTNPNPAFKAKTTSSERRAEHANASLRFK